MNKELNKAHREPINEEDLEALEQGLSKSNLPELIPNLES